MEKTFQYQNDLPRLPIPDLGDTLEGYLEWVQPLIDKEELERTKDIVHHFSVDEGPKLQKALGRYLLENELSNWTSSIWEDIYLKPRVPLVVEGNVFYVLENKSGEYTQTDIAARVIIAALEFKNLIDEEKLGVDRWKGTPLCMEQYKKFFSSTRIPGREKDQLKSFSNSNQISVLFRSHLFLMEVYEPSGKIKSYTAIKQQLETIMNQDTLGEGIGVLTSLERDRWAEDRLTLINEDRTNRRHLEKIESTIFAVCLDQTSPQSLSEISTNMLYGEGFNRWFDKSIQFIITKNSYIGINMEHTGMDGSTMSTLIEYLVDHIDTIEGDDKEQGIQKPEKLKFQLNSQIRGSIHRAKVKFKENMLNNETRVLNYSDFGTREIKNFGISPDAFVQIAIQWAQYRLFGKFFSQYEAVMMRKFLSGRIEVMYAVTMEALKFIESMEKGLYSKDIRRGLLKKAAQKHIQRVKECQSGKGVDSHLMGLLMMYHRYGKELGITVIPALFDDPSYRILTHSTICTSTTSPYGLKLAGWGPVVEDGFAIRYIKYQDRITFNMVSRKHKESDLDKLVGYIRDSLVQLASLMEQ